MTPLSEEVAIKYIGVELCRLNALNSKILRKAHADVLNILINQTSLTYDQLSTALLIGKLYGTKHDLGEKSIEALSENEKLSQEIEGLLNTNASIGMHSIELESAIYKITLQELQNESEKDPSNLNKLFLYICKFHRWPSCPENASDETKVIILSNNMILKTYLFVDPDKLKPLITDATKNAIIFFLNNYTPKTEDEQKCRITRLQDVIRGYDSITGSISKFFNKNVYTLSGDEEIVDAIGKFSRKTTECQSSPQWSQGNRIKI